AQLSGSHDSHGLLQIPYIAGMEVGRGQRDISQRRRLEDVLVTRGSCYLEATFIVSRQHFAAWPLHDAEREVSLPAQVDAAMARRASLGHEDFESPLFRSVQSLHLSAQELIEPGVGREQCRLKYFNGTRHVFKGDRVFFTGKRL